MKIGDLADVCLWWKHGAGFGIFDKHLKLFRQDGVFEIKRQPFLALNKGRVFVLKGPRQCGKTTYVKQLVEHQLGDLKFHPDCIVYFSCDFLTSRELREKITWFFDSRPSLQLLFLFLDEINEVRGWDVELKWLADNGLLDRCCVVATGSRPAEIKRAAEKSPGRGQVFCSFKPLNFRDYVLNLSRHFRHERLFPASFEHRLRNSKISLEFSLGEIEKNVNALLPFSKELRELFGYYLLTGGFPKPITLFFKNFKETDLPNEIPGNLYQDFILSVLGDLNGLGLRDETVRQLLEKILSNYASKYDFNGLAQQTTETRQTIKKYVDVLEDSVVAQVLYSHDLAKVKYKASKKIYFTDPFYYHSLDAFVKGEIDGFSNSKKNMLNEECGSKILEAVVANHLLLAGETPYLRESNSFLWFYDNGKKEIDFLVKGEDGYSGIEVKHGSSDRFPQVDLRKKITLCKDELQFNEKDRHLICPYPLFLALLEKSPSAL